MGKKVLIGGGTGLIGSRLSELLEEKGYQVMHLSRRANKSARFPAFAWDLKALTIDKEAIEEADFIINLAGANVAKPWTKKHKQAIIDSRVKSNELLLSEIRNRSSLPKAYLAASAIGFYGDKGDDWVDEEGTPGTGFLTYSTQQWENAILENQVEGLRNVMFRIGLVLSNKGGVLEKLLLPLYFFIGTYFGNGKQWYSWIHIDDLCEMFIYAMEKEEVNGIYNAVSSPPHRNKEFTRILGKAMKRPFLLLPAPAFALRLFLGEMADAVLTSTKVDGKKIKAQGFKFQFENLEEAVSNLLSRKN